ncbi:MAG: TRAP transporter small permease subunit [Xanthomonadales bacterium]|nr:TRAP transporter small permease subunit [Xanthomonadales bacterium]
MNRLLDRSATLLERLIDGIGWCLLPFALYVVVGEFSVTALRYGIGFSQNWLNESVLAANAAIFLLGAAWALQHDQHVRVDVCSRRFGPRGRAIAELIGLGVFLLPVGLLIVGISFDYVLQSYRIGEHSREADGLPYLWLQKALIPAGAVLLLVAGIARALRQILRLRGVGATPVEAGSHAP